MFVGFNINFKGSAFSSVLEERHYYHIGKTIYDENKADIAYNLGKHIVNNDVLSANDIMNDWFPQVDAQVFLSHSHQDERKVIALAGWLREEAGITAFVDSCAWGYCDKLINRLDRKYQITNNVAQINQVRAHVYMMLNSALLKMIDNTECLMFFNTPQSLIQSEAIAGKPSTYSLWIYSELLAANLLRRKSIEEHRGILIHETTQFSGISVKYQVCLDRFEELDADDINAWRAKIVEDKSLRGTERDGERALDILYDSKGLFEKGYRKAKAGKGVYG